MTKTETLQLAVEAGLWDINDATECGGPAELFESLERFANLVDARAADAERDRNTKLLYQMHERAAAQHSYYKHAAIEINRKARSQS